MHARSSDMTETKSRGQRPSRGFDTMCNSLHISCTGRVKLFRLFHPISFVLPFKLVRRKLARTFCLREERGGDEIACRSDKADAPVDFCDQAPSRPANLHVISHPPSFHSQCGHRVEPGCAPSWPQASKDCNQKQQSADGHEHRRIQWLGFVKHAPNEAHHGSACHQAYQ